MLNWVAGVRCLNGFAITISQSIALCIRPSSASSLYSHYSTNGCKRKHDSGASVRFSLLLRTTTDSKGILVSCISNTDDSDHRIQAQISQKPTRRRMTGGYSLSARNQDRRPGRISAYTDDSQRKLPSNSRIRCCLCLLTFIAPFLSPEPPVTPSA